MENELSCAVETSNIGVDGHLGGRSDLNVLCGRESCCERGEH